eukprot:582646-Amphidinium_carterae.1
MTSRREVSVAASNHCSDGAIRTAQLGCGCCANLRNPFLSLVFADVTSDRASSMKPLQLSA